MVHFPKHPIHLVFMNDGIVMLRLDSFIAELEVEGFPIDFIMDELYEYLEIYDELKLPAK